MRHLATIVLETTCKHCALWKPSASVDGFGVCSIADEFADRVNANTQWGVVARPKLIFKTAGQGCQSFKESVANPLLPPGHWPCRCSVVELPDGDQ